jgi:hypothetical protein
LAERFPEATVLAMAAGDEPGQAVLHFTSNDQVASLDRTWGEAVGAAPPYSGATERVPVTTADELISEYGDPALIKIDTEGFDHRVLAGLSRPIEHILFEVHAKRPDDAVAALNRLKELGRYEFRVSPEESWSYQDPKRPEKILAEMPNWGSVYARRIV